jgi:hypothetical protein
MTTTEAAIWRVLLLKEWRRCSSLAASDSGMLSQKTRVTQSL